MTVGLSVLVATLFLSIGFNEKEISFLFGATNIESDFSGSGTRLVQEVVYIMIFTNLIAGGWLTFIAIILALISCASIFPRCHERGGCRHANDKSPFTISGVFGKVDRKLIFRFYPGRVVRRDCVCGISLEARSLEFFGFLVRSCGPASVS